MVRLMLKQSNLWFCIFQCQILKTKKHWHQRIYVQYIEASWTAIMKTEQKERKKDWFLFHHVASIDKVTHTQGINHLILSSFNVHVFKIYLWYCLNIFVFTFAYICRKSPIWICRILTLQWYHGSHPSLWLRHIQTIGD